MNHSRHDSPSYKFIQNAFKRPCYVQWVLFTFFDYATQPYICFTRILSNNLIIHQSSTPSTMSKQLWIKEQKKNIPFSFFTAGRSENTSWLVAWMTLDRVVAVWHKKLIYWISAAAHQSAKNRNRHSRAYSKLGTFFTRSLARYSILGSNFTENFRTTKPPAPSAWTMRMWSFPLRCHHWNVIRYNWRALASSCQRPRKIHALNRLNVMCM